MSTSKTLQQIRKELSIEGNPSVDDIIYPNANIEGNKIELVNGMIIQDGVIDIFSEDDEEGIKEVKKKGRKKKRRK